MPIAFNIIGIHVIAGTKKQCYYNDDNYLLK